MQYHKRQREPFVLHVVQRRFGGVLIAVLGLGAGCLTDTDVDLCGGEDPLPECVDGALPNPELTTAGQTGGDSTQGGDSGGCNPTHEPTWDSPVSSIIRSKCASCHYAECSTYTGLTSWIQNGLLRQYVYEGHYISGSSRTTVLDWIDNGAPQHDCDVP